MQIRLINNIANEDFENAVKLGDDNSKTLGFLPKVAFEKYANDGQLLGAFDTMSNELIGYLLYRVAYNKVTIVHCCINESRRNENAAFTLVDYLKKNTKHYDGIKLSCRNDYGINMLWERCNFVPVKEKRGRSKKGLPLTIWWYPHHQNNLLTQISDYELNNKIVAVIDMNIFLDIKNEREKESLALKSDWLLSEAILYYTREIYVEIHRGKTNEIKESSRKAIAHFQELPFKDEDEYKRIFEELSLKFPQKTVNDKSDLNHLAYSISGGAQFFLTRDSDLLDNKEFFKKYNLTLFRPSDFITHLDEIIQVSKYKPKNLIGTNINSKNITAENVELYISTFLKAGERKSHLQKIVRNALSSPKEYELLTISKKENLLALVIFERKSSSILKIPIFRMLDSDLKTTLSKHLLYKAILTSINENRNYVEIDEKYLDSDVLTSLSEARFTKINNCWKKINLKGITTIKEIDNEIGNHDDYQLIKKKIATLCPTHSKDCDSQRQYLIERFLSPVKIMEIKIPTYIIPIKPHWAEQLFQDKSNEKLPFFDPEYELLLNRENVYYRSSKPKILDSPSRILWYQSENKSTKAKGHICASSYIDEVFIDNPKKLFKQFEELGIYDWKDIAQTAGNKKSIMAFIFSDTELFKNRISIKSIETIFKKFENKNFMIVTPINIKQETYIELYKQGMEL